MNRLFLQAPALILITFANVSLAQVDIYQSDAYSVEEMCAREAEQNNDEDYSRAYDRCLEKNRENPRDRQAEEEQPESEEHS